MTAPTPQPHALTAALPLPQQTELILSRLLRHLTLYQVQTLADQLDQVLAQGGFGEVSVVIEKGHARRVRLTLSVDITPALSERRPDESAGVTPKLPPPDLSSTPVIHANKESP